MNDEIIKKFETDAVAFGAMYILPDGRMLDLSMLENGHAEFWEMADCSTEELRSIGWLRLNTKLKYVELPQNPTEEQRERLQTVFNTFGNDFQIK